MNNKKLLCFISVLLLVPLQCWADVLNIKQNAPHQYVVKKDDTLWDISALYLAQPWLWPELWRTNTHIDNPHLIYPGDKLSLGKNKQGETIIELLREPTKVALKLSPKGTKISKLPEPIPVLPWASIAPYIEHDLIMQEVDYERYAYILGNQEGSVLLASHDLALAQSLGAEVQTRFNVLRKQNEVYDVQGNSIGIQVRHVAFAQALKTELVSQRLITIEEVNYEVKRGDRLLPLIEDEPMSITLKAAQQQRGYIIDDLEQHRLLGKHSVVILNLGAKQVTAGTVMGVYSNGPNITENASPKYEDENNVVEKALSVATNITQPAVKIGELVIFKVFSQASYALITKSSTVISRGAVVARP